MSPRFCGSCGAALDPGSAFCGACGSAVAGAPQPAAAPPPSHPPAPPPQPAPAPPPYHHVAPPAAPAPPPAYGHADWNSVEVQPGETSLGSWVVALLANGRDPTGALTVTDRRILFKPKVAGFTLMGMLLSQRQEFKDAHTLILSKDQIVAVHSEKGVINTRVIVTAANGAAYVFNRGLMSADPILAAIQQR